MRTPLKWLGGKGNMLGRLKPLLPPMYSRYVEPFFGGGSLFFALPETHAELEVINDLDEAVAGFYRVLRDPVQCVKFMDLAQLTLHSRKLWEECLAGWCETEDPVRRAWMWWVVVRQGFGGHFGQSWTSDVTHSRRGMVGTCSKLLSAVEALPDIHRRLQRAQIECADGRVVLERYAAAPEVFAYVDPPYVPETRDAQSVYQTDMGVEQHEALVETLLGLPAQVLVSGYDCDLYRKLDDAGWRRVEFETGCYVTPRTRLTKLQGEGTVLKGAKRTEVCWMNYELPLEEAHLI